MHKVNVMFNVATGDLIGTAAKIDGPKYQRLLADGYICIGTAIGWNFKINKLSTEEAITLNQKI